MLGTNKQMLKFDIARIRTLHQGFKMLCDSFTMSKHEFEQILGFNDSEGLFNQLDTDANGVIDAIEVFTLLAIFSDSRLEDRFRFLFELYDFNERQWLEEIDLGYWLISGIMKPP